MWRREQAVALAVRGACLDDSCLRFSIREKRDRVYGKGY